jgi:type VI secretion system protein VasG
VLNLFYQVFDRGFMRDGEGREIDFKNTVLILTSNLGAEAILDLCPHPEAPDQENPEQETPFAPPSHAALIEAGRPALTAHFAAALLARMQIVPLRPLDRATLRQIIAQKLDKVAQRMFDAHNIPMRCTAAVIDHLASQCHTPESGARAINTLIEQNLLPGISRSLLGFMVDEDMPQLMSLEIEETGELTCVFSDLVEEDEPRVAETGTEG